MQNSTHIIALIIAALTFVVIIAIFWNFFKPSSLIPVETSTTSGTTSISTTTIQSNTTYKSPEVNFLYRVTSHTCYGQGCWNGVTLLPNGSISVLYFYTGGPALYNVEFACGQGMPPSNDSDSGYTWMGTRVTSLHPDGGNVYIELPCYNGAGLPLTSSTPNVSFQQNVWVRGTLNNTTPNSTQNQWRTIKIISTDVAALNLQNGMHEVALVISPNPVVYGHTFQVTGASYFKNDSMQVFAAGVDSIPCRNPCTLTFQNGTISPNFQTFPPGNYRTFATDLDTGQTVNGTITILPGIVPSTVPVPPTSIITTNTASNTSINQSLQITLSLSVSSSGLNKSHIHGVVSINLTVTNLLPNNNNVSVMQHWPTLNGLSLAPDCGGYWTPLSIAMYKGYYTISDIHTATPLQILQPPGEPGCGNLFIPAFNYYEFAPTSDNAALLLVRGNTIAQRFGPIPLTINFQQSGYWIGNATLTSAFQNFTQGNYTVAGADSWNQTAIVHFEVT